MKNKIILTVLFFGFSSTALPQITVKPSLIPLQSIIQRVQRERVKMSCGTAAGQCVTDIDYSNFQRENRAQQIAEQQRRSDAFRQAARAFRSIPENERNDAAEPLRQSLRKTWAELGRISCEGQTDAGVQMERDIANALVDAALELLRSHK